MLAVSPAGHTGIELVAPGCLEPSAGACDDPTTVIAAGELSGYRFTWAPDSRSIIYRAHGGLNRTTIDGDTTSLVGAEDGVGFPTFTADGALLYSRRGALRSLAATEPAIAHEGLVTVSAARAPRIAGWDGEQIFVADLTTGEQITLFSGPGFFDVELSPDGELALVRESRGPVGHFWVAAADGSSRRDLGVGYGPRLAPDGDLIVYVEQENDGRRFLSADLYLVATDGSQRVRLTETRDVLEITPVFSPDGRRLAYIDAASGRVHVATLAEVMP